MGKQDRFYENKHKKERRNAACPELNNEIYIAKARHRVVPFALSTIAERYSKHHSGYHFSGISTARRWKCAFDDSKIRRWEVHERHGRLCAAVRPANRIHTREEQQSHSTACRKRERESEPHLELRANQSFRRAKRVRSVPTGYSLSTSMTE